LLVKRQVVGLEEEAAAVAAVGRAGEGRHLIPRRRQKGLSVVVVVGIIQRVKKHRLVFLLLLWLFDEAIRQLGVGI
jgi:hypothetical protein